MQPRTNWIEPRKRCTKCGTLTDRLGVDPVTGRVGIPMCERCSGGGMIRLCVLVAALCLMTAWII